MNRILLIFAVFLIFTGFVGAQNELTTLWEKSEAQGTRPDWFDTGHLTRGFSYGNVDNQERLYVVSRNGGSFIYILDAANGDSLGMLDNTGITGGTYHVSDVGVSDDGVIFVCNLALNTTLKVYSWDSEAAAPVQVITFDASGKRLGDKINVTGSVSDNSVVVWAASASTNELVKFTTTDNGATFVSEVIDLGTKGGSASASPLPGGDFYYNAVGVNPMKFSENGTLQGTVPGSVVSTASNSIRFLTTLGDDDYFVTYQYGTGNENARIVRAPGTSVDQAMTYTLTPTLGTNSNPNGSGDVAVKENGDGTFTVFVLSTNNGLGAYKVEFPVPPIEPVNLTLNWETYAGMYPFFAADNNTRGIGHNPATNHVLVASRSGGAVIYALDGATGTVVDTLDMTGVSGGILPLMKVVADDNGVVYACNLVFADGEFKVYRWADESAAPTVAFSGTVSGRTGDAFSITGSDTTTVLYASGSSSETIYVLTTRDGEAFVAETAIPVAAGTARGGIAAVMNSADSDLWINGSGTTLRKVDTESNVLAEISGGTLVSSWMNCDFVQAATGAKLVAVNASNVGGDIRKFQVWDVTHAETTPVLWAQGEAGNLEQPNANGAGEIIINANDDGSYTVYQMATNNAITSWTLEIPQVIETLKIAEAKADDNGDFAPDRDGETVTITGVVTSPNYGSKAQYYLQDETAGIVLYSGSIALDLAAGDLIQITGEISQYRGLTQISPATAEDVSVLGAGNDVEATDITIADIGEPFEAKLVRLKNVWVVDMSQWPAEGSNGRVDITDGTDTTYIYIDKESDLDGWMPPAGMMNLTALVDQYSTATPPNDGYSLRGTFKNHFEEVVVVEPPDPLYTLWANTQAAGTFPPYISTSNYTRGMAYGKVDGQDRVYVVTRLGAHRIVIHDAMTGDSLGVIAKPTQAEGVGLFHLNCVDVSDDGIIFACNMSLGSDTNHPFRVYRWDNETADPVTVINNDAGLGRMGDMFSVYGRADDNTLTIYSVVSGGNKIVKYTTTDNGMTFAAEEITLADGGFGTVPNVAQAKDGTLWIKSYGRPLVHINADGSVIDTVSTTVVGTGASKIAYGSVEEEEFIVVYYPDLNGSGAAENLEVVMFEEGAASARIAYESPSIGAIPNGNGAGSVDWKMLNEETLLFFILGTNNGIAAFSNNEDYIVAKLDTLFQGDTPTLHENPFGAGFITGTNSYGDIGKYQRFDMNAGDKLFGMKYYFAYKQVVGDDDTLKLVVKARTQDGAPGDLLAEIHTPTSVLDTTLTGNMFFLDNPLMVDGPVFVGFEFMEGADDTVAIYADANGEGDEADRAWEQTGPDTYQALNDPGTWSWHLDADLWIKAYLKTTMPSAVESRPLSQLPEVYEMSQNYPNPFNPVTSFNVKLPVNGDVKIAVYNTLGQRVAVIHDGQLSAGSHRFEFAGHNFSSGVYYYRVDTKDFTAVRRMMLVK
ncbi:T9SS type A sorting domain-containing protein [candidate division KSB1 bacterium]|nr:T9SS type A sorting domain-containing protein [candidate division KSB1 bacterium]